MFKVGDVLKVINGRRGDRYRVIDVFDNGWMNLRNVRQTDPSMNFSASANDSNLELDKTYDRKKKLEKILDNIDSLNIMEKAEALAEMNRRWERLMFMELRKNKIEKICSKTKIK